MHFIIAIVLSTALAAPAAASSVAPEQVQGTANTTRDDAGEAVVSPLPAIPDVTTDPTASATTDQSASDGSSSTTAEGTPAVISDDAVVGTAPPAFDSPLANDGPASTTTDPEWVASYQADGTLLPVSGPWPLRAVLGAQLGAGLGVGLIFAPAALALILTTTVFLPHTVLEGFGTTGIVIASVFGVVGTTAVVAPAVIAGVQTFIGDWVGATRGALVWPLLGSYITAAATVVTSALTVSAAVAAANAASRRGERVDAIPLFLGALLVPAVTGLVVTVIAPTVTYFLTAEQKRPGDDGHGFPGLLAPGHAAVELPISNVDNVAASVRY